jgi:hypothetical protein
MENAAACDAASERAANSMDRLTFQMLRELWQALAKRNNLTDPQATTEFNNGDSTGRGETPAPNAALMKPPANHAIMAQRYSEWRYSRLSALNGRSIRRLEVIAWRWQNIIRGWRNENWSPTGRPRLSRRRLRSLTKITLLLFIQPGLASVSASLDSWLSPPQ